MVPTINRGGSEEGEMDVDNGAGAAVTKVSLSVGSKLEKKTGRGGNEPGSEEGREVGGQAAGSLEQSVGGTEQDTASKRWTDAQPC